MKRIPLLFLASLALAFILAACGGGGDGDGDSTSPGQSNSGSGGTGQSSGGAIDPCNLLTRADVEALLGAPLPEPDRTPAGPFQTCAYYKTISSFVQVQVCRCLTGDAFDRSAREGAEFLEIEAKPVSGIGDKAYWLEGILWVQKGNVAMNVWLSLPQFFKSDGEALRGAEFEAVALPVTRDFAQKLLGRIN